MASIFQIPGKSYYSILYFDENHKRRKKQGYASKAETERLANTLEEEVRKRRDGLIDPSAEAFRDHDRRPLTEHLADFERGLVANGRTAPHIQATVGQIRRVLNLTAAKRISDLSPSKILDAMKRLRDGGLSTETTNHLIRAVKAFSRWLHRDKRAREHQLADLSTTDTKNDRRRVYRRLTDGEASALVGSAERSDQVKFGLSGLDRAALYLIAHGTGFRAAELRSLTPERFRLNDDPPTITVLGCYTKNGQEAVQPIAETLADRLRPWLATKVPKTLVFEGMSDKTAAMVRFDLEAAGIPYETDEGIAAFHASRVTYISNLVASGASVKTCQTLARHADPSLTIGIYAKASLHDVKGAVEKLPDLFAAPHGPESLRMTGTDGSATQNATRSSDNRADGSPQVPFASWEENQHESASALDSVSCRSPLEA
jgi:site-specific recombinase XerD